MSTEQKLIELIRDFDNAMLVTRTEKGELDARPMAIAKATEQVCFGSSLNETQARSQT